MRPRSSVSSPIVSSPSSAVASDPAGRVEDRVGSDLLSACELRDRAALEVVDLRDLLAEAEDDVQVAQVVAQRLDDLRIAEIEQFRARVDDVTSFRALRTSTRTRSRLRRRRRRRSSRGFADREDRVRVEDRPSLNSTSGTRAGVEPVAITIVSAVSRRSAPEPSSTAIVCSSTKRACRPRAGRGCAPADRGRRCARARRPGASAATGRSTAI